MNDKGHESIARLAKAAKALERVFGSDVIFVGGTVVPLYIVADPREFRPTIDIDSVVKIKDRHSWYETEEVLRKNGFSNDTESGVICRWRYEDLIIDIMPDRDGIVGETNRWYAKGEVFAIGVALSTDCTIRILPLAYFLATKLDAFWGRGEGDFQSSKDMEDIFNLILHSTEQDFQGIFQAPNEVLEFLNESFRQMHENEDFIYAIEGNIIGEPKQRKALIQKIKIRLAQLAGQSSNA